MALVPFAHRTGSSKRFLVAITKTAVYGIDCDGQVNLIAGLPHPRAGAGAGAEEKKQAPYKVEENDGFGIGDAASAPLTQTVAGDAMQFHELSGVAVDSKGRIIVTDVKRCRLYRITLTADAPAEVQLFAGSSTGERESGESGDNKENLPAQFEQPRSVCVDNNDHAFVLDQADGYQVRRIDATTGAVTVYTRNRDCWGICYDPRTDAIVILLKKNRGLCPSLPPLTAGGETRYMNGEQKTCGFAWHNEESQSNRGFAIDLTSQSVSSSTLRVLIGRPAVKGDLSTGAVYRCTITAPAFPKAALVVQEAKKAKKAAAEAEAEAATASS